ncbi:4'-phosphopantetheinyl transferase family protein [Roseovarius sp. S1116L3]|uniref:4'-phosphopantetheinyl transferase family protein n=1 Tax=Roseovarius roseus TaxID=3342636 RepID=UPI003728D736
MLPDPTPGYVNGVPDGVVVSVCQLDDDRDMPLDEGRALLSPAESARAERFHFERDRHRQIRGRAFLRREVGRTLGADPRTLILTDGPDGKPRVKGPALEFNLSHSGDLAVLAISERGPVGIDVELIDRRVDVASLARSVFAGAETDTLLALSENLCLLRFLAFWTAKEARMKLTGEGMGLQPLHIALELNDGWPVGYLRPATPAARAAFVDLGDPRAICCLALMDKE